MNSDENRQLLLTIGALLASEREKKDIPIEKAAKETRMRAQRIRDMENDDLSSFTNPSYARMFIIAYAKYLGIPMQQVRDLLPERGETGTEGYHYVGTTDEDLPSLRPNLGSRARPFSLFPLVITLFLLAIVCGGGLLAWWLYLNLPRLTERSEEPVPIVAAPPLPSAEEELRDPDDVAIVLAVSDDPFSAAVSPTPANDPLLPQLDEPIDLSAVAQPATDDLASDVAAASLEQSMPAPANDPVAPSMPLEAAAEADRAFLLQNGSPATDESPTGESPTGESSDTTEPQTDSPTATDE